MRTIILLLVALAGSTAARADFSYTMTRKTAQGAGEVTKTSVKGQKMMIEGARTSTLIDFDAQTVTAISHSDKTYRVRKFAEMAQPTSGMSVTADVKETGQKKNINGYDASEMLMTVETENPGRQGMQMQLEIHIWVARDVPGAAELSAFYRRNRDHFPWAAIGGGAASSMGKAMADIQRKLASLNGVPVLEVIKTNMGGAQQAQMEQMRARLEEMQKQGGQQAAMASQALARMGGGFETTMEGGNYSTAGIPDSVFAIPAGYTAQH
ncbi:MAG TPA: DUF4412 domain-containing protein [Bryobacteraceae bacterium]|nr:DUF4412 domain-containing protein [Bryobacteraceae bacterium]